MKKENINDSKEDKKIIKEQKKLEKKKIREEKKTEKARSKNLKKQSKQKINSETRRQRIATSIIVIILLLAMIIPSIIGIVEVFRG